MSAEAKLEILLEAIDKASAVFAQASANISGQMDQVAGANDRVEKAQKQVEISAQGVITGFSGAATAAFSLYQSIDRVEKAQYMVEKANLAVQRATESAETAQNNYNAAVSKYGEDSAQAKDASDKLRIANEAVSVATERARLVQNDFNSTLMQVGLSIIPAVITGISSAAKAAESLGLSMENVGSTIISALSNPITLAIAGVAALGVGIYSWIDSMNKANQEQAEINRLLGESQSALNMTAGSCEDLSANIEALSGNLGKLKEKYAEADEKVSDVEQGIKRINELYGSNSTYAELLTGRLRELNQGYYDNKDALGEAIDKGQEQLDMWGKMADAAALWVKSTITSTDAYKSAVEDTANRVSTLFNNTSLDFASMKEVQVKIIQELANEMGVSWDQAYSSVKTFMDNSNTEMEKLTANLESEWNKQQAAASAVLPVIAKWFDEAFSEGRFTAAADLVERFAAQFDLSFADAEGIIEAFKDKTKEIPQTIEEQLVGRAQADFETFKNCMSGKALTLNTDVVGNMAKMASNITDLISAGLVGEAQAEMQAYVNCSTSKVADMTVQINGYMEQLTKQHNEKLASLSAMAAQAYGAEKDSILAAIGAETAGYQEQMSNLVAWQHQLFAQLMSDAASIQGGINAVMASAASALQSVQGNYAAASAILNNVWAVTKSAKAVAALAAQYGTANPPPTPSPDTSYNPPTPTGKGSPPTSHKPPSIRAPSGSRPTTEGFIDIGLPVSGAGKTEIQPTGEEGTKVTVPELRGPISVPITIQPAKTGPTVNINAPVVQIQGNADAATAKLAVDLVMAKLKNVIVEPSSSGAPSTVKMIRVPAIV